MVVNAYDDYYTDDDGHAYHLSTRMHSLDCWCYRADASAEQRYSFGMTTRTPQTNTRTRVGTDPLVGEYMPTTTAVALFISYLQDLTNGLVLPYLYSRNDFGQDLLDEVCAEAMDTLKRWEL